MSDYERYGWEPDGSREKPPTAPPAPTRSRRRWLHRLRLGGRPRGRRRRHRLGPDLQVHRLRGRDRRLGDRLRGRLRGRARRRRPSLARSAGDRDRLGAARRPDRRVPRLRLPGAESARGRVRPALGRRCSGSSARICARSSPYSTCSGRHSRSRPRGRAPARGGARARARAGPVALPDLPGALRDADRAGTRRSRNPVDRLHAGCRTAGASRSTGWSRSSVRSRSCSRSRPGFNPYRIPSSSMEPTLHSRRTRTAARRASRPRACESLHLSLPRSPAGRDRRLRDPAGGEAALRRRGTFVKRLIGLPGERVELRNIGGSAFVFIDGSGSKSRISSPTAGTSAALSTIEVQMASTS